jgi:adenylate cyclase
MKNHIRPRAPRPCRLQASHATFVFADLCGFTEFTCRHGDERAADLAIAFHGLVRAIAADERCEVVKSLGDGAMIRAADCAAALRFAHRLLAGAADAGMPRVRVGLDAGPAVERDGDWYGSTVNAAARLADAAGPGEVLVSDRARSAIGNAASVELIARGARHLKGLPPALVHAAAAA